MKLSIVQVPAKEYRISSLTKSVFLATPFEGSTLYRGWMTTILTEFGMDVNAAITVWNKDLPELNPYQVSKAL